METISKNSEIKNLLKNGTAVHSSSFIFLFKKNNLNKPRFVFIASKKFSKKAVDRNRAKRLLREAIRQNYKAISNIPVDIALIAKKSILKKKSHQVAKELKQILEKVFGNQNEKSTDFIY